MKVDGRAAKWVRSSMIVQMEGTEAEIFISLPLHYNKRKKEEEEGQNKGSKGVKHTYIYIYKHICIYGRTGGKSYIYVRQWGK